MKRDLLLGGACVAAGALLVAVIVLATGRRGGENADALQAVTEAARVQVDSIAQDYARQAARSDSLVQAAHRARQAAETRETQALARLRQAEASTDSTLGVGGGKGDFDYVAWQRVDQERRADSALVASLRGQIAALASANEALRTRATIADSLVAAHVRLQDAARAENDALADAVKRLNDEKRAWQVAGLAGGGLLLGAGILIGRGTR